MRRKSSSHERALAVVAEVLGVAPEGLTARALRRGVTHETLIVEAAGEPVAALRLVPDLELLPGLSTSQEADLLRALSGTKIPAPTVLLCDDNGSRLGNPGMILSYVHGQSTLTWERLRELGGEGCAEEALSVLVRLHRRQRRWDSGTETDSAAERAAAMAREARTVGAVLPADTAALIDDLARRSPAFRGSPSWVHGDFRPANLMVDNGRLAGVLDWEMAGRGDPARDLGVATMKQWGTWWPDAELLRRYEAAGARPIELSSLRWWRCLGYAMVALFLARRIVAGWAGGPALLPYISELELEHAELS